MFVEVLQLIVWLRGKILVSSCFPVVQFSLLAPRFCSILLLFLASRGPAIFKSSRQVHKTSSVFLLKFASVTANTKSDKIQ